MTHPLVLDERFLNHLSALALYSPSENKGLPNSLFLYDTHELPSTVPHRSNRIQAVVFERLVCQHVGAKPVFILIAQRASLWHPSYWFPFHFYGKCASLRKSESVFFDLSSNTLITSGSVLIRTYHTVSISSSHFKVNMAGSTTT